MMTEQMNRLELRTRQVGPWQMNTYALVCPHTRQSVLIDPGDDPDTLEEMLEGSEPIAILLTHTHPDHVGALEEMRQRLNVPVLAHAGPHFNDMKLNVARHLAQGDTVRVGRHLLNVYYTPGHIADQISFVLADDYRAIVGDTIFEGGPGKTHSAANFQTTLETLRNVVLSWPDATICYPGHGPHFTLGDKRAEIEAFVERDHGDFFGDATWDQE
jgi:glyoxylase-like metal-dependent hydrolase (beta-lactamase superfamily II)